MEKINAFATPFYIIPVDLEKIVVPYQEKDFQPTFESGMLTTLRKQSVPDSTYAYLRTVIEPAIRDSGDPWVSMKFMDLWRNRYTKTDYQSSHIHPHMHWSFIIYEDVRSQTVFENPATHLIQNQCTSRSADRLVFRPKIEAGNMILFPSWISHMVLPGNEGHTMAGNIRLKAMHDNLLKQS